MGSSECSTFLGQNSDQSSFILPPLQYQPIPQFSLNKCSSGTLLGLFFPVYFNFCLLMINDFSRSCCADICGGDSLIGGSDDT